MKRDRPVLNGGAIGAASCSAIASNDPAPQSINFEPSAFPKGGYQALSECSADDTSSTPHSGQYLKSEGKREPGKLAAHDVWDGKHGCNRAETNFAIGECTALSNVCPLISVSKNSLPRSLALHVVLSAKTHKAPSLNQVECFRNFSTLQKGIIKSLAISTAGPTILAGHKKPLISPKI